MAKRNSGRRKRRPARTDPARRQEGAGVAVGEAEGRPPGRGESPQRRSDRRRGDRPADSGAAGERPRAPWHPLPLSELLILIGGIGVIVGLKRGISSGGPTLLAGLGAVVLGTLEVTLREHLGGFRSHTLMLALLPVIVFHSGVVLIVAALAQVPRALNIGLLAIDGALFAFLFKLLRARFLDARHRRGRSLRR